MRPLIFLAASTLAGALAGLLAWLAYGLSQGGWTVALAGAAMGGAAALSTWALPKVWMRVLIAPVIGTAAAALVFHQELFNARTPIEDSLWRLVPIHLFVTLLCGPVIVLQGRRLNRGSAWRRRGLILAGCAGLASGVALGLARGMLDPTTLVFCAAFALGQQAALELSIRP